MPAADHHHRPCKHSRRPGRVLAAWAAVMAGLPALAAAPIAGARPGRCNVPQVPAAADPAARPRERSRTGGGGEGDTVRLEPGYAR